MRTFRRTSPFSLAVITVLCLSASPAARGQGTWGMVPDPISSRDLERMALGLGLTDAQRQALDAFHKHYLDQYRTLRQGEIEELLQQTGRMWGRGFPQFDREQIEQAIKSTERVMSRIRSLDDEFFGQLQVVLDEEQAAMLPRSTQERARQRYATGASQMVGRANQAARTDLGRLYEDLELSPQERQAADPFIIGYETRLTEAAKELYETSTRMFLDMLDALAAQGVDPANPGDIEDGEARARMFQGMMAAWAEASKKTAEQAASISDLNRKALKQVAALLSPEMAAQLRGRYLRRAYPDLPMTRQGERAFGAALRLDDLPADLRPAVEAASTQFAAARDAIIEEAMEYVDAYRRDLAPGRFMGEGRQAYRDQLEEIRTRLAELDGTAVESLKATLGPELSARLDAFLAAGDPEDRDRGPGGAAGGGPERATASDDGGPDPFVPRPIGRREAGSYPAKLGLADSERYIVQSLYEDYAVSWERLRDSEVEALRRARESLNAALRDDEATVSPGQVERVYELRQRLHASVMALDAAFFDDLEALTTRPEQAAVVGRLRQARQRYAWNRGVAEPGGGSGPDWGRGRGGGPGFRGPGGESREWSVDVATIVDELDLAPGARGSAEKALAAYEAGVVDAFRTQYETALRLRKEADLRRVQWRTEEQAQGGDGEQQRARWEGFRESMEAQRRALREANDPVVNLNREALAAVTEALPEDSAATVRRTYSRKAWPGVYNVERAAERYLGAALALPDLDEERRQAVTTILDEYAPAYEAVCARMIDAYGGSGEMPGGPDPAAWQRFGEQRRRIEMLAFDRDELNARAIRQLRGVLDDLQEARIGLPTEQARAAGG